MLVISEQGLATCDDDGCLLLNGMVRECAYRLRDAAELERKVHATNSERRNGMTLGTILLIVLILVLVGALPTWPHSKSWGYYPSGGLGLVVLILLLLVLMGRL